MFETDSLLYIFLFVSVFLEVKICIETLCNIVSRIIKNSFEFTDGYVQYGI